jgi:hypothetical protein
MGASGPNVEHLVAGKHDRERTSDRQHAKGHDEGRHSDIGHEEAGERSACEARQQPGAKGDIPGIVPGQQQASDDGDKPHDRADGQIDAAGDQHHGHPQAHDRDRRKVARNVGDVVGGAEAWFQPGHEHHQRQEGDGNPERLSLYHTLKSALLANCDHVAYRGVRLFDGFGGAMLHGSLP